MVRKFIISGALITLIGIIMLSALNVRYINTNYYKGLNNTEKFRNVPDRLELVNLGTSHALHGLGYDNTPYKNNSFNFALDAQRFYYDYNILRQYANKVQKGAVVIIPVSYFSFYLDQEGESFMETNPRYYSFLYPKYIKKFTFKDFLRYGLFPILSAGENIKYMVRDRNEIKVHINNNTQNFQTQKEIEKEGKETALRHMGFAEKWGGQKTENVRQLMNIVEYCRENGFKPVLITTPYTTFYYSNLTEGYMKDFYDTVGEIKEAYNVPYLDYSHDERFQKNKNLFFDSSHLNRSGRNKFMPIILEDLKKLEYLM